MRKNKPVPSYKSLIFYNNKTYYVRVMIKYIQTATNKIQLLSNIEKIKNHSVYFLTILKDSSKCWNVGNFKSP